eukprot:EG_transcript_2037
MPDIAGVKEAPDDPPSGAGSALTDLLYTMIERKDMALYHSLGGVEELAQRFQCHLSQGLTHEQVAVQRERFGCNVLPHADTASLCALVWAALGDPMMRILILAAAVSIGFGLTLADPHTGEVNRATGWVEGAAILVSVALVVLVTAGNDYTKAKKFEAMAVEQAKRSVEVVRDGATLSVDVSELVVGDLVRVAAGQTLAADGVLVGGCDLKTDESAATGETDAVSKQPLTDPFFISGTDVLEGDGLALVINVGVDSFAGKLAMSCRGSPADTPLQVKLQQLAEMIGKLGLAASVLTFLVLAVKETLLVLQMEVELNFASYLNFLLVAITLVVVAIPEGLPLAVTIALAYSMKNMMRDHCLVRVLAACETMGGARAICSDKTGTLTQNRMAVATGWLAGQCFTVEAPPAPGDLSAAPRPCIGGATPWAALLAEGIVQSSVSEQVFQDGATRWVGGNKTEHGLMEFAGQLGANCGAIRRQVAPQDRWLYHFSSARKRMTAVVRRHGRWAVFTKGAAELVLSDCAAVLTATDRVPLDPGQRAALQQVIRDMADDGQRTIAVAYAEVDGDMTTLDAEPTVPLTLIAILGLHDPVRAEVPAAVAACQSAGIAVRMVTGDHRHTAVAVAKQCGLLAADGPGDGEVMEGPEFRQLAADQPALLHSLLPRLRVLARSSPTDKLVLVAYLMDAGDVVAVTGDGTNDAPALKLADVGFAMKSGTDVATGAAAMVLMDDNFATVVRAAAWGRTVNDNIRKFLQFQLTVNVAGVLFTFVGSALSPENEEPLKPVQLLWLNLIMDTLGALALATEAPAADCLTRPGAAPVPRDAPLISGRMWRFVLVHASFQLAMVVFLTLRGAALFAIGPCSADDPAGRPDAFGRCVGGAVNQTVVFNVFIWMQLFNELNARKLHGERNVFEGMGRSCLFFFILLLCATVQFCAVQYCGQFMATVPLTPRQWALCVALAALELPLGLALALWPLPHPAPAAP